MAISVARVDWAIEGLNFKTELLRLLIWPPLLLGFLLRFISEFFTSSLTSTYFLASPLVDCFFSGLHFFCFFAGFIIFASPPASSSLLLLGSTGSGSGDQIIRSLAQLLVNRVRSTPAQPYRNPISTATTVEFISKFCI